MRYLISLFLVFTLLLCATEACAKRKDPIKVLFDKKELVMAYIYEVKNSSGDEKIDLKDVKAHIENALLARKSQKFEIVDKKSEADIIINMEIVEYEWAENDPVDMIVGTVGVAYDIVTQEHYAYMRVKSRISAAKTGNLLWKKSFKATNTSSTMTEEKSYPIMNEKIAKIFIKELFRKPKK